MAKKLSIASSPPLRQRDLRSAADKRLQAGRVGAVDGLLGVRVRDALGVVLTDPCHGRALGIGSNADGRAVVRDRQWAREDHIGVRSIAVVPFLKPLDD